ncbi:uncharacterized protein [Littorina saxatilis]|uniref:Methyltransferase domain-containing protein n=1 Tax=Littorina saxatilis TaxID=31220 RepID=A0AAN9AU92_9CAEN
MARLCSAGTGRNTVALLASILFVNGAMLFAVNKYFTSTSQLMCTCPEQYSGEPPNDTIKKSEKQKEETGRQKLQGEQAEEKVTQNSEQQLLQQPLEGQQQLFEKQRQTLEQEHQIKLQDELQIQKVKLERECQATVQQALAEQKKTEQQRMERPLQARLNHQIWEQIRLLQKWWGLRVKENSLVENATLLESLQRSLFLSQYWTYFESGQPPLDVTPPSDVTEWWKAAAMIDWLMEAPAKIKCQHRQPMGNWMVCMDPPYTVKPPCLVYSFGIAFDFSFDDAMGAIGCEVHSFDPSMKTEDHKRNDNVTFHKLGLSGVTSSNFTARRDSYVKGKQIWTVKTLDVIMKDLGHEGRTLDVLKIDVEGHEWAVVDDLLKKNILTSQIRQFMLEWHLFPDWPSKDGYSGLYDIYRRLKEAGFTEYSKHAHPRNLNPDKFNLQADDRFVNTKFTPR